MHPKQRCGLTAARSVAVDIKGTLTKRLKAEAARALAGVPSALKRPSGCSRARHRPHTFLLVSRELECRPYTFAHLQVQCYVSEILQVSNTTRG
jgi:hypothetical protein